MAEALTVSLSWSPSSVAVVVPACLSVGSYCVTLNWSPSCLMTSPPPVPASGDQLPMNTSPPVVSGVEGRR